MFLYEDSLPVPATIGALARIIINRDRVGAEKREENFFLTPLYTILELAETSPRGDEVCREEKQTEDTTRSR